MSIWALLYRMKKITAAQIWEEADLLARAMLVLWDYRDRIPAAQDLLDEYEALVMSTDEEEYQ